MPNGTTFVFAFAAAELEPLLQRLPGATIVGSIGRETPAEFTALSCAGLRQLLHDHPQQRIVIEEEKRQWYVLRLVPPLVYVRRRSQFFAWLKRTHPGGLHIFEKDAVDRMLVPVDSNEVVGHLLKKQPEYLSEDVTSVMLLDWLRNVTAPVTAFEQDGSWYVLELGAPVNRKVPRIVAVPEKSVLVEELNRLGSRHSTGQ